jgi:hypothetical protein
VAEGNCDHSRCARSRVARHRHRMILGSSGFGAVCLGLGGGSAPLPPGTNEHTHTRRERIDDRFSFSTAGCFLPRHRPLLPRFHSISSSSFSLFSIPHSPLLSLQFTHPSLSHHAWSTWLVIPPRWSLAKVALDRWCHLIHEHLPGICHPLRHPSHLFQQAPGG